jgi:hypothetical protein
METVKTVNGNDLPFEGYRKHGFKSLECMFELKEDAGKYLAVTDRVSEKLEAYAGKKLPQKVAIQLIPESFFELQKGIIHYNIELENRLRSEREAYLKTRPQVTALVFHGHYLMDEPKISVLFQEENLWYIAKDMLKLEKIKIKDVQDMGLTDCAGVVTGFESRCFSISGGDIKKLSDLNKQRVDAENKDKLDEIQKESKRIENLISKAMNEGKRQFCSSSISDCDGSVCECSTDIITTYINPDGSFSHERSHTH